MEHHIYLHYKRSCQYQTPTSHFGQLGVTRVHRQTDTVKLHLLEKYIAHDTTFMYMYDLFSLMIKLYIQTNSK